MCRKPWHRMGGRTWCKFSWLEKPQQPPRPTRMNAKKRYTLVLVSIAFLVIIFYYFMYISVCVGFRWSRFYELVSPIFVDVTLSHPTDRSDIFALLNPCSGLSTKVKKFFWCFLMIFCPGLYYKKLTWNLPANTKVEKTDSNCLNTKGPCVKYRTSSLHINQLRKINLQGALPYVGVANTIDSWVFE
jgi:hypothetical protein